MPKTETYSPGSYRTTSGIFLLAKQYEKKKIPFTLIGTNGSYKLESFPEGKPSGKYFSKYKTSLSAKELGFVRRVKNYIMKNEIYLNFLNFYTNSDVTYTNTKRFPNGTEFNDIYEVDIDEAYWKTAFELKIISKELYNEGAKASMDESMTKEEIMQRKVVRLIALGSLAKKSKKYSFQGDKVILKETFRSESVKLTENIWFNICKKVSDAMCEVKKELGSDYLMFWVDGIYFSGKNNIDKVQEIFKKNGYASKIKKIEKVKYENSIVHIYDNPDNLEKETPRTFHLPNENKTKRKKVQKFTPEMKQTILNHSK